MNTKKIKTESDLRLYLTRKWWDCLVIDDVFVLTETLEVKRDVRLVCSKYGMLLNHISTKNIEEGVLIKVEADYFAMERFDSIANTAQMHTFLKLQRCKVAEITSKCAIEGNQYAGIWAFDCDKTIISDCTIIGDGTIGNNYAVWQGGKGDAEGQVLTMQGCTIKEAKHAIGAHYGKNSYYAIGNTISTLKHSFDRHNSNDGTKRGGMHHVISGNTFLDPDRLAFSIATPYEGGSLVFTGNTLNHARERHIGEVESVSGNYRMYEGDMRMGMIIHGNKFVG